MKVNLIQSDKFYSIMKFTWGIEVGQGRGITWLKKTHCNTRRHWLPSIQTSPWTMNMQQLIWRGKKKKKKTHKLIIWLNKHPFMLGGEKKKV